MKTNLYCKFLLLILLISCNISESFSQIPINGLIGYYSFDGHAKDSSGFEHDGAIIDAVSSTQGRNGNDNGALFFNGGYVDIGNPIEYQMTNSISISAWINPVQIIDWHAIVTKWNGFD